MENLGNKELNKAKKQQGRKSLSSNPMAKKLPIDGVKMISTPVESAAIEVPDASKLKETKNKLNDMIKPISFEEESNINSLFETINNFNTTKTKSRSYTNEYATNTFKVNPNVNYFDVMKNLCEAFSSHKNMADLISQLNNLFVHKLKWNFVGFGLLHEKSKCINLKLYSKTSSTYTSKVFLSDENNPIVQAFNSKSVIDKDNINYLNIPYLVKTSSVIVPMISINKCIGVVLVGQNIANINLDLVSFFANHLGMFIHNVQLSEQTNKFANTDTLTSLYNHRGFQEILATEMAKSKDT